MVLGNKVYVPTLAVRASEMNGLEFLPGATKDRMVPCFLLAPWANANSLDRTVDRIERAFPNRRYILDIDRDYNFTNLESEPQQELSALLDPSDCYINWSNFIAEHDWVLPCLQTRGQSEEQIKTQVERIQETGKAYCLRIVRDRFPDNADEIVSALSATGSADFIVLLEGGWARDPLGLAVWFSGIISGSLEPIDAEVPIVISTTSIPKMFSTYSGISRVPTGSRLLFEQVRQATNRAHLVYGDWGSTRPREVGGFATRPFDRIDYPTSESLVITRDRDKNWDFRDAARELVNSSGEWDGNLGIWGEEMILQTTINEELGINTPQKNVASRVNIHLHRQAFYGEPDLSIIDFDEDWED